MTGASNSCTTRLEVRRVRWYLQLKATPSPVFPGSGLAIGSPAPGFDLADIQGGTTSLKTF